MPSSLSLEGLLLILVALVAANLAFVSPKFLFIQSVPKKHVGWCLLEMLIWYAVIGVLGYLLESSIGNTFPKRWEFFAVTVCLFLVAAFPWRFLIKHRNETIGV